MVSLPQTDLGAIFVFVAFIIIGLIGASVSFLRTLDLAHDAPHRIRFWAELGRRLAVAAFVSIIGYSLAVWYGIKPPILWVVAALTGTFAGELLDLSWVIFKDRILAWAQKQFAVAPEAPKDKP